jgi:hypothetical protein
VTVTVLAGTVEVEATPEGWMTLVTVVVGVTTLVWVTPAAVIVACWFTVEVWKTVEVEVIVVGLPKFQIKVVLV